MTHLTFYRKYAEKVSKSLSDCSLHYFECFVYHFMLIITSGITWQNDNKNLPIVFWSFLNVKLVTWPIILKHIHCWLLLAHICYEKIAHKSKIAKLTNFEFFSNDVIVTGNDQNWYHVWRNDQMITSYHISAKKHIVGISLSDSYCMQRSLHFNRNWMKTLYFHEWYSWRQVPFYAVTCSFRMIWVIWVS